MTALLLIATLEFLGIFRSLLSNASFLLVLCWSTIFYPTLSFSETKIEDGPVLCSMTCFLLCSHFSVERVNFSLRIEKSVNQCGNFKTFWGWIDDSVLKSVHCTCRGPECGSQNSCPLASADTVLSMHKHTLTHVRT